MAVLGLRFCARAFSSCGKRGPLFIAVRGPLIIAASLAAEHRLQTRRLSNCGSRAQPLRGMWDLPRPGLEPVSPALAGRFSTTAPPGKPGPFTLNQLHLSECWTHLLITRRKFFMLLSVFPTLSLVNFYFGHLSPCLFLLWFFKTWCFSDFPSFLMIYAPLDWSDRFF